MENLFSNDRLLDYPKRLNRLRFATSMLFIVLFIPLCVISFQGYQQYKRDLLTQYEQQAGKITDQINRRLFKRAALANAIPIDAFDYYQTLYNPVTGEITKALSPLTNIESFTRFKGHLGYFQRSENGQLNSPVWPSSSVANDRKLQAKEYSKALENRRLLAMDIFQIINSSAELTEILDKAQPTTHNKFDVLLTVPDYYVFYRAVNVIDQIKVQGYVLHRKDYLTDLILDVGHFTPLNIRLAMEVKQDTNQAFNFIHSTDEQGQIAIEQPETLSSEKTELNIGQTRLNWPYKDYVISYSTSALKLDTTTLYSIALMFTLLVVLSMGCYGMYFLGKRHLILAEQRLNFVSSVSHELKTPLTSIRMYAEMLKSDMVISNDNKKDYYEFIHSESERLSRLIDNILQLSSLNRQQNNVKLQYTELTMLADIIRSKISSMLENSGFELVINYNVNDPEKTCLLVDLDAFSQVIINITDNAIKFFDENIIKDDSRKKIDVTFSAHPTNTNSVMLEIRDYGIGIDPIQENKIFELFYRGGNELTRSTQGTGIGLALVSELVNIQQGSIKVRSMNPGLAMQIKLNSKLLAD